MSLPHLPAGYEGALFLLSTQNIILAMAGSRPVLWLDEALMRWREVDRHVSQLEHGR